MQLFANQGDQVPLPAEMCSGSEEGSYLRLIDCVYHSTLGLRRLHATLRQPRRSGTAAEPYTYAIFPALTPYSLHLHHIPYNYTIFALHLHHVVFVDFMQLFANQGDQVPRRARM